MGDSDQALDILIRTLAETAGADKVQEALDRAKTGTKDLGKAHEEAGKAAEKSEFSHRELHRIFHSLSDLIPGLGQAMMFAISGAAGATAVLVMGVQLLAGWLDKIREKYREAGEAAAASWRAQYDANNNAEKAARDYAKALTDIVTQTNNAKAAEEQEAAVLAAIAASRLKILEAQEKAAMAAAKGDPLAEARVAAQFGAAKTQEQLDAERAAIILQEDNQRKAEAAAKEAFAKSQAAERAKEAGAPGVQEKAEADLWLEQHKDDLKKAMAARIAAEKRGLGQEPGELRGQASEAQDLELANELRSRAAEIEETRAAEQAAKAAEAEKKAIVEAYNRETERLTEEQKKTFEEFTKLNTELQGLDAAIAKAKAVLAIHEKTASDVAEIGRQAEAKAAGLNPTSPAVANWQKDIEAEEGRAGGTPMSQAQAQGVRQLVAALKAAGNGQEAINQIIADMMDLHKTHEEKLQELARALKAVKAQVAASADHQ